MVCGVWDVGAGCGVWRVACGVWRVACGFHSLWVGVEVLGVRV